MGADDFDFLSGELSAIGQIKGLIAQNFSMQHKVHHREVELVLRLARAAECRDPETGNHIIRMALYAALIARELGMAAPYCDMIKRAAPLHDIGKLGIPDNILLSPNRLTTIEFDVMKQHPSIGHSILSGSDSPLIQMGAQIALHHHEKFDGTGYPDGLAGEQISLPGRIVAVADVFDALTSSRPYKKAWSLERTREHMLGLSGSHFDPGCVDALFSAWPDVLKIHQQLLDT